MEGGLGHVLQCEEQLKNTLHNNDKDKLRRKLAVLQKEYLRTVQRLKRAEHVESRRTHVRSRITLHNHHDESEADVKPIRSSVAEEEGSEGCKGPQPGLEQIPQLSYGVTTSLQKNPLRSQAVHFSLMPDGAYSPTSDSSQDSCQNPRSSLAHRLRSRRSRIRWAERSAHADQSTANSQEEPKKRDKLRYTENQKKAAQKNWTGFLLPPSSPTFSPPPHIIPLLKNMLSSDILDFHLPDDQFGSLKLLKLHQIISGVEQLISNNSLLLSPSLDSTTSQLTLPKVGVLPRALPLPLVYSVPRPNVLTPPGAPESHCQATVYSSPSSDTLSSCLPPAETGLAERILPERLMPRRGEGAGDSTCSLKGWACARLVDMCCVPSSSGSLSLAAAGQWIVSLWSQRGPQNEWNLTHTWSFVAPVLRVFPIPDTPDCICLTLGQLEIQQVRLLSCSSLGQSLLCTRPVHLVIAASMSRVVCCSNADSSARLWILRLSNTSSPAVAHALVTPGVLLSSLATVEGLSDALIGMDHSGCLYIWNMVTGHLLRKLTLGEGLSHSTCLRGYSCNGALFVLLQHHKEKCIEEQNEGVKTPFSLVVANPQNDKCVLATNLSLPEDCSRLSCAEALGSRVLGLSSGGSVCVWDLAESQKPRPVCGSVEGLDCHLARWGTPGILLTALDSGDVTLHCYSEGSSRVMHTLSPMQTEGKPTAMHIQTP
uniref:Partner and localiser of BRCA2 WD40 domain-containing protein n=1 Tax=Knipowitschia caucasica TaxID=637954 RepID=A0AAV2LI68_KNICA